MKEEANEPFNKVKLIKSLDQTVKGIYFSPKKRQSLKESTLDFRDSLKLSWEKSEEELEEEGMDREKVIGFTEICAKLLALIEEGEKWSVGRRLKNKRMTIYKSKKGPQILIELKFFKPGINQNLVESWILKTGLPTKTRASVVVRKKKALSKKGYQQIDQGVFYQKLCSFTEGYYRFKTPKQHLRFKCYCKTKSCRSYGVTLVDSF